MSSHDSTPSSPISTSSTLTEERSTRTMADVIKKYKTEELIDYLRRQEDLDLIEADFKIFRNERISGLDFIELTKDDFRSYGMKGGPATRLVKFIESLGQRLRTFSSYKTKKDLEGVMRKFGIDGNDIRKIPPFKPETEKIEDDDEKLQHCINDLKNRMGNLGSAVGSNEALRCEYISTILHAGIHIAKRITKKKISLDPQFEVIGEEATGRVDYAIKKVFDNLDEELICITEGKQSDLAKGYMQNIMQLDSGYHTNKRKRKASEAFDNEFDYLYGVVTTAIDWHFIMYTPEKIYQTKAIYNVPLTEDILEDDTELRRGVKKVMEVIVGLLKDRVDVDDSPASKKARTGKYIC